MRFFPILLGHNTCNDSYIPWELIAPHEEQALKNHDQSLEKLASRGGLGWCEALAVLEDKRWHRDEHAKSRVLQLWSEWDAARFKKVEQPTTDRVSASNTQKILSAIKPCFTLSKEAGGDGRTVAFVSSIVNVAELAAEAIERK